VWDLKDTGVTRQGNKVTVKAILTRSTITPTNFTVKPGDIVTVALTNIEQTTDELHGFGLLDYNINVVVDPGETKTVTFKADKQGVFPYYCTNFCSALDQEMRGYLVGSPTVNCPAPAGERSPMASVLEKEQLLLDRPLGWNPRGLLAA